jgi:hypothetical protein
MQQKYLIFCLINAVLVLAFVSSSCSKYEEDISAPDIDIRIPVENDTIQLQNSSFPVYIFITGKADLKKMVMNVKDVLTNTNLGYYGNYSISEESYTCDETIKLEYVTAIRKVTMTVTCENEYKASKSKSVAFYVKH